MELKLIRKTFTPTATLGELHINGTFFAYTLEDVYRGVIGENPALKVKGKTAIDYGRFKVITSQSARFKKELPELLNVPCFDKIRIHGGNTEADTEGCILIGANTDHATKIWGCAEKVLEITKLIKDQPNVFITIVNSTLA